MGPLQSAELWAERPSLTPEVTIIQRSGLDFLRMPLYLQAHD